MAARMYLEVFSDNAFDTNCWLIAAEGTIPRPGHPADTIVQDGVNGLSLYRANMLRRTSRPQPARSNLMCNP